MLTLGFTRKLIPPPWYKGGGLLQPLLRVVAELLSCDLQNRVNIMGYGAAEVRDVTKTSFLFLIS